MESRKTIKSKSRQSPPPSGGRRESPYTDRNQRMPSPSMSAAAFGVGLISLLVATGASLALVLSHFDAISLPGCHAGGPCAEAANSVWGKIPGILWPVSFIGLAYFSGLLVAWLFVRQGASALLRWLLRLGVAASAWFLAILLIEKHFCQYCIAAHAANFVAWLTAERAFSRLRMVGVRPVPVLVAVFAVITGTLAYADRTHRARTEASNEKALQQGIKEISAVSKSDAASEGAVKAGTGSTSAVDPKGVDVGVKKTSDVTIPPWGDKPFTGRYRLGPEQAAIRIVMYKDYQCKTCRELHFQLEEVMKGRNDISFTMKQFPMSSQCNPEFPQDMHQNACWAARAAEAAGILRGNDGFWEMHHWLFNRGGGFTDAELKQDLPRLGFNVDEFLKVMQGEETLARIQSDCREATWLGLYFTPMVFINGVELRGGGIFANRAVPRAIEALIAQNLEPRGPEADHPPPAMEKCVEDWRVEWKIPALPPAHPWPIGSRAAKVQILVWGDYQEPYSAQADRWLRGKIAGRSDVLYEFRPYPFDNTCNKQPHRNIHPLSCATSQAVYAAGLLGGQLAFWNMHEWIMAHQPEWSKLTMEGFAGQTLQQAANDTGLDYTQLRQQMAAPQVDASIQESIIWGKERVGLGSVPWIIVNGRRAQHWNKNDGQVLDRILAEAAAEPE